jgi:hypothetical protein
MQGGLAAIVITLLTAALVVLDINDEAMRRWWDGGHTRQKAACGIAEVSLTRQQWADYAGTQPFQQVCPAG